ncbi:hypothetical protein N658DRAFT_526252 [Parathielavia hyrcaniae]|uniref:Uncharacterized protein n=1 Tax=Parathielavia hyrcaniae TaxID=113614 RepID=A0AAN6SYI5_9PEZI|nr:hypothetical protein N658DRAFT_526252 [Parathielavia hyrcaniae]
MAGGKSSIIPLTRPASASASDSAFVMASDLPAPPPTPNTDEPLRSFTALPVEIRLLIYRWLIPPDGTVVLLPAYDGYLICRDCRQGHKPNSDWKIQSHNPRHWRPWHRGLRISPSLANILFPDQEEDIPLPPPRSRSRSTKPPQNAQDNPPIKKKKPRAELLPESDLAPVARYHSRGCGFCCGARKCREQAEAERARREGGVEALGAVLGLMATCRVVRAEVSEVFFARVTFRMRWADLVRVVVPRAQHVPVPQDVDGDVDVDVDVDVQQQQQERGVKVVKVAGLLRSVRKLLLYEAWIPERDVQRVLEVRMPRLRELVVDFPQMPGLVGDLCYLMVKWLGRDPMPELRVLRLLYRYHDFGGCLESLGMLKLELDGVLAGFAGPTGTANVGVLHVAHAQGWTGTGSKSCRGRARRDWQCYFVLVDVVVFPIKLILTVLSEIHRLAQIACRRP